MRDQAPTSLFSWDKYHCVKAGFSMKFITGETKINGSGCTLLMFCEMEEEVKGPVV